MSDVTATNCFLLKAICNCRSQKLRKRIYPPHKKPTSKYQILMSAFIEGVRVPLVKHVRCLTLSGPSSSADIFFSIRRSYKAIYLFSQYRIKFASISSLRPAARSRIKTGRSALFQTAGNQKHCSPSLDSEQSIAHYTAELLTQATSRCE